MQKIGEGFYYSVHELSPTRVVKKETRKASKLFKLITWYGYNPFLLARNISSMEETRAELLGLSKRLAAIEELKDVLGNPVFTDGYEYEQDRAVPLGSLLDAAGEDDFLSYVQQYLDANVLLWRHGYGEIVYNFTLNAGVSEATGKVILLDFNELTRSKERMAHDIASKKWRTQASMLGLRLRHSGLYTKVLERMESVFTAEVLDANWEGAR